MLTVTGHPDVGAPPYVPAEALSTTAAACLPTIIAIAVFVAMVWYMAHPDRPRSAAREKSSRR